MSDTDQKYKVATHSYVCTAYVRTTLRRALEMQPTHNVWAGTEYVNTARGMMGIGWSDILPDETTWELTKLELMTVHRALEWRKGRRGFSDTDRDAKLYGEWDQIGDEINRVLTGIWHSEGKYWM